MLCGIEMEIGNVEEYMYLADAAAGAAAGAAAAVVAMAAEECRNLNAAEAVKFGVGMAVRFYGDMAIVMNRHMSSMGRVMYEIYIPDTTRRRRWRIVRSTDLE
jgi:hypothetical protein